MTKRTQFWQLLIGTTLVLTASSALLAQGGRGPAWARQGGGPDPQFVADRDVFHFLLQHHDQIRREVKDIPTGVESKTESDNPEIAAKIQEHVAAMKKRVEERRPIRMRDPLFAELFRYTDKIVLKYEKTPKGVHVVETSSEPYVAQLIQAHGGVVSLFVKNGFEEARKNHAVPGGKSAAQAAAGNPVAVGLGVAGAGRGPACPGAAACPLAAAGRCPVAGGSGGPVPPGGCPGGCPGCPAAAAACPLGKACPSGAACPAAQGAVAGKACDGCPNAAACAAAAAGKACAGCPNAGTCAGGTCPQSGADAAPPLPQKPAKAPKAEK